MISYRPESAEGYYAILVVDDSRNGGYALARPLERKNK